MKRFVKHLHEETIYTFSLSPFRHDSSKSAFGLLLENNCHLVKLAGLSTPKIMLISFRANKLD